MDRRKFILTSAAAAAASAFAPPLCAGAPAVRRDGFRPADLDAFIRQKMEEDHIPGVAAALFDREGIFWGNGYGWADIPARKPMTLDTLQNVASISKTFTTMAVMQLREEGLLDLDDDVNDYMPFPVVNPRHPEAPIPIRTLMVHTSSLRDGTVYSRHYHCGDPRISLAVWLREYFTPGGRYYDAEENFQTWAPGAQRSYTNVSYAVLGYLVERLSGMSFPEYCRRRIFDRLDLPATAWFLRRIDRSRHAVPYTWFDDEGEPRGPAWGGLELGVIGEEGTEAPPLVEGGYRANCLYNHSNYPDGFLRTSVRQLARYARAYLNDGVLGAHRILDASTVRELLTPQLDRDDWAQGLTWYASRRYEGEWAWGHSGGDPGVNTDMRILRDRGVGAIAFANTHGIEPGEITHRLLTEALKR
jgi:CubicO group peptidase (beta-lactamase class C family)